MVVFTKGNYLVKKLDELFIVFDKASNRYIAPFNLYDNALALIELLIKDDREGFGSDEA